MDLPYDWLKEYVDGGLSPEALAELLTHRVTAIDALVEREGTTVLVAEVLSNRPDLQCLVGFAREVALLTGRPLKYPELTYEAAPPPVSELARLTVTAPDLCPRYTARIIRGVTVGPSPEWLQRRLRQMGLSPINNVVDVTNFVLFEMNQPLHAFDLDKLAGRHILVRRAVPGERFLPLYTQPFPLDRESLVIADEDGPVALAGVLGGLGSGITEETRDILLEAAYFDPPSTRRTVRRHRIVVDGTPGTDSSYRFERGVDYLGVDRASRRACRLIQQVAGGTIQTGVLDSGPRAPELPRLRYRRQRYALVMGQALATAEHSRILAGLGCEILEDDGQTLTAVPPSWRARDLTREIDLIEEVARIAGYERIGERISLRAALPPTTALEQSRRAARQALAALGYDEVCSDSLVAPRDNELLFSRFNPWEARGQIEVQNPSNRDRMVLRVSLLPSMLQTAGGNARYGVRDFRAFEIGKVYLPSPRDGELPYEQWTLSLADERDFPPVKGALEGLAEALRLADGIGVEPCACSLMEARQSGRVTLGERPLGWVGQLAEELCRAYDWKEPLFYAEINFDAIIAAPRKRPRMLPLPAQPHIARDVSLVVAESVRWGDIEARLRQGAPPILAEVRFLEVFCHRKLGPGRKSLNFSLRYHDPEDRRALTDREVNDAHQALVESLRQEFRAELRK